jgi:hypothetical protein
MGSWSAGPFGNDAALDYVGGIMDRLMSPVRVVLETPTLGSHFLHAMAAIAIMREIMRISPVRPWDRKTEAEIDPRAIRTAFIEMFDAKFNDEGDPEYRAKRRASMITTLDEFVEAFGV